MGQHKLPRINFRLTEEQKQHLERWAKSENRTVSNLVETLVGEALSKRHGQSNEVEEESEGLDANTLLVLLVNGKRPSDEEIIDAAQSAGIPSKKLLALRDRLFPKENGSSSKRSVKNA